MTLSEILLDSILHRFRGLDKQGRDAIAQVRDGEFTWQPDPETNSIAVIVKHMHGNMLSRWTDFLTSDGEKAWRKRDDEFIAGDELNTSDAILSLWDEGWKCTLDVLTALEPDDLLREVEIRGQKLTVPDAINRQIAHYSYHIGQLVQLAHMLRGSEWKTLSIARGESLVYNAKLTGRD